MHEEIPRTIQDKLAWLWSKKYWDAVGCGHSGEFAEKYANKKTAELRARLRERAAVELVNQDARDGSVIYWIDTKRGRRESTCRTLLVDFLTRNNYV